MPVRAFYDNNTMGRGLIMKNKCVDERIKKHLKEKEKLLNC